MLAPRRHHRLLRPDLRPVTNGLGLIPTSNGVHYDSEEQRRPLYHRLVADGTLPDGHATDDGVGLVYRGTELVDVVADRPTPPPTGWSAARTARRWRPAWSRAASAKLRLRLDGERARGAAAGLVDYEEAWERQRELHARLVAGEGPDTLLLLEHPPVYTAGKRTEPQERPLDGTPVIDVDRGGKITWHGPGQLVGYPIVRLPDPIDVVAYVRRLEEALIDVCAGFGLATGRVEGRSGVWVPPTTAARTARSPRSASASPGASPCTASRSTATPT